MDEQAVRTLLQNHLAETDADVAHQMYHADAVLDFPQSGERFEGVENFREWRRIYPAQVDYDLRRIRGRNDLWVVELVATYDGGPLNYGVAIYEFRGDKVSRESIYVAAGWEAPGWRAQWRAASPPEPDPAPAS